MHNDSLLALNNSNCLFGTFWNNSNLWRNRRGLVCVASAEHAEFIGVGGSICSTSATMKRALEGCKEVCARKWFSSLLARA